MRLKYVYFLTAISEARGPTSDYVVVILCEDFFLRLDSALKSDSASNSDSASKSDSALKSDSASKSDFASE